MAWAFVIWLVLPDSPLTPGRFFNEREKEILARRFYESAAVRDRQPFRWYQFVEALVDVKTWIYLLMGAAIYVSGTPLFPVALLHVSKWCNVILMLRLATLLSRRSEHELSNHGGSTLCRPSLFLSLAELPPVLLSGSSPILPTRSKTQGLGYCLFRVFPFGSER